MTAREAMAHGRPVVAAEVGGLVDLPRGVVFVPPRDPAALRHAIDQLLLDAPLRRRVGDEGREFARRALSPEATATDLRAAYTDALNAATTRPSE
jgi:glycosyltransferase involved in cell wall biosynthesis